MVFAGMLPWSFFFGALSDASNSLLSNEHLISEVYLPRLILPTAAVVLASGHRIDIVIEDGSHASHHQQITL